MPGMTPMTDEVEAIALLDGRPGATSTDGSSAKADRSGAMRPRRGPVSRARSRRSTWIAWRPRVC